jgi:hypothetical protein
MAADYVELYLKGASTAGVRNGRLRLKGMPSWLLALACGFVIDVSSAAAHAESPVGDGPAFSLLEAPFESAVGGTDLPILLTGGAQRGDLDSVFSPPGETLNVFNSTSPLTLGQFLPTIRAQSTGAAEGTRSIGQGANHPLHFVPTANPKEDRHSPVNTRNAAQLLTVDNSIGTASIDATVAARADVIENSTRMGPTSAVGFLPSAIPVSGQPFFGAPERSTVFGSGSSLNLGGQQTVADDSSIACVKTITAFASIQVSELTDSGFSASIQQAWLQLQNLVFGLSETAFADADAIPWTLDPAGPNARVSIYQLGASTAVTGQGRISYWFFTDETKAPGFTLNLSCEQPTPEIESNLSPPKTTPATQPSGTFSRFPDLIATLRYGNGEYQPTPPQPQQQGTGGAGDPKSQYLETWHIQAGSVLRSLGLEYGNESVDQSVLGWGFSLSGSCAFWPDWRVTQADMIWVSATYGDGIAHYISDLHTPSTSLSSGGNDAVLVDGKTLTSLPALGCYIGYCHNWTDCLRSTATGSHVTLESISPALTSTTSLTPAQLLADSPYHFGEYASINLEYHTGFTMKPPSNSPSPSPSGAAGAPNSANGAATSTLYFSTGIEYLYGRRENLDGAAGHDQQIAWITTISR